LECPHDFYLRKVLGFSPAIDQAFGYGRGVHNLLRAVHSDPKKWADLAGNQTALDCEIDQLIEKGLFYLRYTTGEPAANMRAKGARIVAKYIQDYAKELAQLTFEPEKEFETLVEYEDGSGGALISGAIDIVRQDEMQLQVALYAVAAKKELEYQPEQGMVRYLDAEDPAKAELRVPIDEEALAAAKSRVAKTAESIRDRKFAAGPTSCPRNPSHKSRCAECDFEEFCGMNQTRNKRPAPTKR
jgi:DNA helicase-2/ATP-dependent DNA helicase PcrA